MGIDVNEFYRLVTTQILSTLDLNKAMERTLEVIKTVMPVDRMDFGMVNPDNRTGKIIASVGSLPDFPWRDVISLPIDIIDFFQELVRTKKPHIEIINNPREFAQVRDLTEIPEDLQEFLASDHSMIGMLLMIDGVNVAQVQLMTHGLNRYTAEHAEWIRLLHEPLAIAVANALAHQKVLRLQAIIEDDNRYLRQEIIKLTGDQIIGEEFGLRQVMSHVKQVASSSSPVLLYGETGVGKDLIANALHLVSPRRNNPMIKVNCGAIPDTLIDSELFGHEKGAFTGALRQKRGRFERAHEGTIFLDEIGELPPQAQVRLLRVLQNGEFERVGGSETIRIDARVVAATNRNLEEMVKQRLFREDLYFRLNVFPIEIPPLRQRKPDIPALVHHFVHKKAIQLKLPQIPALSPGSINAMMQHDWPGNVRELENIIERAMLLCQDGVMSVDQLLAHKAPGQTQPPYDKEDIRPLDEIVATHILNALAATHGKIHGADGAAKILGVNPSTLRSRMKKLHLTYRK